MSDAHMRNSDAFSWYMERDPNLRSTIITVLRLSQPPDLGRLTTRVTRLTRELPMWRQRVVVPPWRLANPRWTVDEDFDLSWHLRWESLPSWDQVMEQARRDVMTAFDPAHPLWKVTVIDGLPGGQAAVVMKLHHSLTDGIGGMELALRLFDKEPNVADDEPMPDAPDGEHLSTIDVIRDALAIDARRALQNTSQLVTGALPTALRVLRSPRRAVNDAWRMLGSVARTVRPVADTGSPVMTDRHLGRHLATLEVPLEQLHRAASVASGTLNDAFLASVIGGVRNYHERHDVALDRLRVTLPISLRTPEDPLGGNRITLQRFELAANELDVRTRMRAVHAACRRARDEPAVQHTDAIAATLNLLPSSFIGSMLKHVDVVASNVPGFTFPVYLAGAEVLSHHAFGPTIGAALNVTLLSYQATCYLGISIDTVAAPDPEVLVECLREGFEEVLAAAPAATTR